MIITSHRKCVICNQRTVPRGIDWPYWTNGMPIGLECIGKTVTPQPKTGEGEI